jgi:flagellar secretion chaperone FliS
MPCTPSAAPISPDAPPSRPGGSRPRLDPFLLSAMHAALRARQYQHQALATASPDRLVAKLYDLGIAACFAQDRAKVRAVLVELMAGLDFERGGEVAGRLQAIYAFCLNESALGDLGAVGELLGGLRDAWRDGVLQRPDRELAPAA